VPLEKLQKLETHINDLIKELRLTREENSKLKAQIEDFPYEELERLRQENREFKEEREKLREKIENMLNQLNEIAQNDQPN
jgi:septal ring factor EnvC (AmiA/AmiB activator)